MSAHSYTAPAPWRTVTALALLMLAVVIIGQVLNIVLVSSLQHANAQTRLYDELRLSLSEGSAPLAPVDAEGRPVVPGTPLALLTIDSLGIREVVVEGTAAGQTMLGVGHRRDTPLPGQPGTSVLMGRSGAYGGVFRNLDKLAPGSRFNVVTGQGTAEYEVIGLRRAGDIAPPALAADEGRLTLTTAAGVPYLPDDVLRADAKLVSKPFARAGQAFAPGSLPEAERALGQDTGNLSTTALTLQLLILSVAAGLWAWFRWGKREAWLVFLPVLAAVSVAAGTQFNYLLPNLL
ncbi:sortase [Arthrobacter sp. I2-34]|uniref:Sortase n=1 Tax=Arthrobacter hankyongi TaxID=2904801 RepID=A0ABS9L105_9MICC|nr:sortase [Arthrobacter hankyongi]MCG2620351.1 sortase [Arthrobacter hankyongi]